MAPLTSEQLFLSVDRISSELLWSAAQLNEQAVEPAVRRRTAAMLNVVISGLTHTHQQLLQPKETQHHDSSR